MEPRFCAKPFQIRPSYSFLGHGLLLLLFQVIFCFLVAQLCCVFWSHKFHFLGFLSYLFAVFFIGSRMRFFGNVVHECSHNSFFTLRKMNPILGTFLAGCELKSFQKYRKAHLNHHRYLGVSKYDKDFDHFLFVCRGVNFKSDIKPVHFFTSATFIKKVMWRILKFHMCSTFTLGDLKTAEWYEKFIIFLVLMIYLFLFLLCTKPFFLFGMMPFFCVYPFFQFFSDATDHYFVYENPESSRRSQNHFFKRKFLNKIFYPRNDCYHFLHHKYPLLGVRWYEEAHSRLLQIDLEYAQSNTFL